MPEPQNGNSLSSGDALFLYFERQGQPVNVASVNVFEGVLPLDVCTAYIESKLSLVPRYRQRVVFPPYNMDLPIWENDPQFDIRNHIREVTLRRGTDAEFKALAAKLLSPTMDRERPLWDFTLVQGLTGSRTGAVLRMHHCLADGISGVGVLNVLLEPSPIPQSLPKDKSPLRAEPTLDSAAPPRDGLLYSSISAVQRVLTASSEFLDLAKHMVTAGENPSAADKTVAEPGSKAEARVSLLGELKQVLPEAITLADRLPFNVVCRGPQKFGWAEVPLAEIKAIKQACGVTVNDVVLALVTAAIRQYAQLHGIRLRGRQLRIIVPVNVRGRGDARDLGNRITFLPISIPLDIDNPRELIEAAREGVERGRSARLSGLVSLLGSFLATIPTPVQALLGPVVSQLPINACNLICTNVPGPQIPLYLYGHKLLACYPYVPIGGEMGMNVAILTYNGTAYFGFTGDAHAIPDLGRVEKFLGSAFAKLRKVVRRAVPRRNRGPAEVKAAPPEAPSAAREAVASEAVSA
jgi:WS/DGAT/MGAT family acyltransferase